MSDITKRLRDHVNNRGGPAKDESGNPIGTAWPMMLEAADEIDWLRFSRKLAATMAAACFLGLTTIVILSRL